MIQHHKLTLTTLFSIIAFTLTACGGDEGDDNANRPKFSWTSAAVSNSYAPSGDTTNRTPTFSWPAVSGATEYNLGHEDVGTSQNWLEYTITASVAGCASSSDCSYKPTNHSFGIGNQKAWWVRANTAGQWQDWSSAHVFKVVATPPPAGSNSPVGDITTTTPLYSWSPTSGASTYELGIEKQDGTGWEYYIKTASQFNCQTGQCSSNPNYRLSVGDKMSWWVRHETSGNWSAWSNRNNFTVINNGNPTDTQAPTTPSNLQAVTTTPSSIEISWNAATDNIAVTGYKIFRNNQQINNTTTAATSYTDNSVSEATAYSYTISATDTAGNNSEKSPALSVTTPSSPQQSGLIINEVLAGNTTTNMDTDYYAFSDWIELYNGTNSTINLSDYYLSDDKDEPKKWKIPAGTSLTSHSYQLIWADKKDKKANELHTNFSLSSKGETVTLADSSGTVVDKLKYSKLDSNISVGKSGTELIYMVPTPNKQNSTTYTSNQGSKKPTASNNAGFYNSQLSLTLSQENNADIYYTLDGSTPTSASTRYANTITINETTVIKAVAIESGKLPSKVETNSYFIGHTTTLPVVSLSMESTHLYDDTVGIYTVGTNGLITPTWCGGVVANYQQDWDRPVFVEYFDENQNRALAFGADTGISGECSRKKAKKSFGFELDGKHGTKSLSYKLFPGKDLGKIKDFKIRTANSGYRVGDILGAQLVEKGGLDIDYQAYRAVQMFMNGEYWGIYNIREKKGAETLEANYPNLGKVDIIKAWVLKKGDFTAHYEFNNFLNSQDLSTNVNYQQALTFFDESNFIDYMAFMIYNGNQDWLDGNQRAWKEKKAGAKWRWMSDDIDWGFLTQLDYAGQGTALNTNQFDIVKGSNSSTNLVLLFNGLMTNSTFKAKFKTRFTQLLDTTFTENFLIPIINQIDDERKDYMHLEKFAGMPAGDYVASYTDYIENDIRRFVRLRTATVKQQLEAAIP